MRRFTKWAIMNVTAVVVAIALGGAFPQSAVAADEGNTPQMYDNPGSDGGRGKGGRCSSSRDQRPQGGQCGW